jgi:hypothetical protein
MANNTPHVGAAQEPEPQTAINDREPEQPNLTVPVTSAPIFSGQNGNPGNKSGAQADPGPANPVSEALVNPPPAHPNPAIVNPAGPLPPPPSSSNAVWLAITLLNVVLIVVLLPATLLKSEEVSFIIKLVVMVGAAGAFAAGLVWFQNLARSLPNRKGFKVLNIVLLCTLIPVNVSQMTVVPLHPTLEPGSTLKIDDKGRELDGGALRLSVNNHEVSVTPPVDDSANDKGKPWKYKVTYKEMILAIFWGYHSRWTPLYLVYVNTDDPDVEILIRKTDGDFDADFLQKPEPTKRGYLFNRKPESKNTFVYRGGPNQTGSEDLLHLPYGNYDFIGSKNGCAPLLKQLNINKWEPQGYSVDFGSICGTPQ